jgi:hypothetical protein
VVILKAGVIRGWVRCREAVLGSCGGHPGGGGGVLSRIPPVPLPFRAPVPQV